MLRAKDTFWAPGNRRIVKGDLIAPYDPVVEGREELFEAVVIPQAVQPAKAVEEPQTPGPQGETVAAAAKAPDSTPDVTDGGGDRGDDGKRGDGDDGQAAKASTPAPAAKKTTPRKATTATRKDAGGDAK